MPTLYHLSPEHFDQFSTAHMGKLFGGTSNRIGERGIYLAPSFRDALKWAPTISGVKGSRSRNKSKKQKRVNEEYRNDERENSIPYPPIKQSRYHTLFLYKVEVPRPVLDQIKKHNLDWNMRSTKQDPERIFGTIGSWDAEIFVPEQFLPHLQIVGVKRYDTNELLAQNTAEHNRPKSEGFIDYVNRDWNGKDRRSKPTPPEEYDRVYQARKKFDSQFNPGDQIFYQNRNWTIEGVEGRFVIIKNWKTERVDIIDFLEKVQPPSENKTNWYQANRRQSIIRTAY